MSVILGPGLCASSPVSVNIPDVSPSVTTQDQGKLRDYKDILTLLIIPQDLLSSIPTSYVYLCYAMSMSTIEILTC